MAPLEVRRQQGQVLTADIRVSSDGQDLITENVEVAGAGILGGLFEQVARQALDVIWTGLISREGAQLKSIQIRPEVLVVQSRLG